MKRRGYSLIECLVVISLTSFVLGMVTLTLHGLQRGNLSIRQEISHELSVDRLARHLRDDVHGATSATLIANTPDQSELPRVLKLTIDADHFIEYAIVDQEVTRAWHGDQAGMQLDSFPVHSTAGARWQIDSEQNRTLVTLWLPASASAPTNKNRFCAALGLDKDQAKP